MTKLLYAKKIHCIASCGFDHWIHLWDPNAGTLTASLTGHNCSVADISLVPDVPHEIISVDYDNIVKVWDLRFHSVVQTFKNVGENNEALVSSKSNINASSSIGLCCLAKDRIMIAGRAMMMYEREFSNPSVASDHPIPGLTYCGRRNEVIHAVRGSIRVWSVETG